MVLNGIYFRSCIELPKDFIGGVPWAVCQPSKSDKNEDVIFLNLNPGIFG